jgi:hypothetical protein
MEESENMMLYILVSYEIYVSLKLCYSFSTYSP